MPFVESSPPAGMELMTAGDVMSSPVINITRKIQSVDARRLLMTCTHGGFPVVDDDGRVLGFILRNHLAVLLREGVREGSSMLKLHFFANTLQSKRRDMAALDDSSCEDSGNYILDVSDYMDNSPLTVRCGFPVSKVYTLFRSLGLRHLICVDDSARACGMITRKELMCAFDRDLT